MLTLTDNAAAVIRDLTAHEHEASSGGLRIATDHAAGTLTFSLADSPALGDQVVDRDGARVFLDPPAAQILDTKALDAEVDSEGRVQFGFAEQPVG
jgi:iron-sulfur cluster assembly protein